MMFMGMGPFGAMLAGFFADAAGAPLTVTVGAAICLVGSGIFASSACDSTGGSGIDRRPARRYGSCRAVMPLVRTPKALSPFSARINGLQLWVLAFMCQIDPIVMAAMGSKQM